MAYNILAVLGLPRNIETMTDAKLVLLCDEPEFLAQCTPLGLELITRLGAEMEVNSRMENESQAEIDRLAKYEPKRVVAARMKTAAAQLEAIIREAESNPSDSIVLCQKLEH